MKKFMPVHHPRTTVGRTSVVADVHHAVNSSAPVAGQDAVPKSLAHATRNEVQRRAQSAGAARIAKYRMKQAAQGLMSAFVPFEILEAVKAQGGWQSCQIRQTMAVDANWHVLDAKMLEQIKRSDHRDWWVTGSTLRPVISTFEWQQGTQPEGFNTWGYGRRMTSEISHVMAYRPPAAPSHPSR